MIYINVCIGSGVTGFLRQTAFCRYCLINGLIANRSVELDLTNATVLKQRQNSILLDFDVTGTDNVG